MTIQFTPKEIALIRQKSVQFPQTLQALKEKVREVFEGELIVPETGIGNWTLYYYCPDCSVQLLFDRNQPHHHICPSCGKDWTGEPYDSSWWGKINAQNAHGIHDLAMLYLITEDDAYAKKADDIFLTYAKNYPNYKVHGNIPYNGPGISGAQTLDEAVFQRTLAQAYDILAPTLTKDQSELIKTNIFLRGAQFLQAHRRDQVHNHEVIVDSTVATIGILLRWGDFTHFGLYSKYGLYYQLERGMQSNGMWFEGTFGYHVYALESFMAVEKFALHTPFSDIANPNYRKMFALMIHFIQPDGSYPLLNDTNLNHLTHTLELFEFANREIGGPEISAVLARYYEKNTRDNLESLLYGVPEIEKDTVTTADFHTPVGQSGYSILHGRDADGKYLLIKHNRFGGEHDHYDRLALNYLAFGKRISTDLGTTGYGAKLHYAYYKNTGTHNTVTIGEKNQAPVNAVLTKFEKIPDATVVEAVADWTAPYEKLDSFTIKQWSENNYRTVKMKRTIIWTPDYFVDVFLVDGVSDGLSIDWQLHFSGVRRPVEKTAAIATPFSHVPFTYFKNTEEVRASAQNNVVSEFVDDEVTTRVYSMNNQQQLIYAMGPANPSTSELPFLIERQFGTTAVFAHVIESFRGVLTINNVHFKRAGQTLTIQVNNKKYQVALNAMTQEEKNASSKFSN